MWPLIALGAVFGIVLIGLIFGEKLVEVFKRILGQ
jgi:xanthosine utilization system XapX-like protein